MSATPLEVSRSVTQSPAGSVTDGAGAPGLSLVGERAGRELAGAPVLFGAASGEPGVVGRSSEGRGENGARAVCTQTAMWSAAETALLAALPDPADDLEDQAWCELEDGHSGWHHALAQISGPHWWWLRWDDPADTGLRGLVALEFCGDPDERAVECSLPHGHVGAHSHQLCPD